MGMVGTKRCKAMGGYEMFNESRVTYRSIGDGTSMERCGSIGGYKPHYSNFGNTKRSVVHWA